MIPYTLFSFHLFLPFLGSSFFGLLIGQKIFSSQITYIEHWVIKRV
jgi:hypothetical protein